MMDEKVKTRECTAGQKFVRFMDERTGAIDTEV